MPNEHDGLPIKLEASAKLGLEIKGEVPATVMGRLGNALADAISPFTERQGLKGDLIRLQREEVAIQAAERAQAKVLNAGELVRPIPNRVLVPMLEKASLEEPESEMLERWADLLAATSTTFGLQHPIFADVLSRISEREVKFLDLLSKRVVTDSTFNIENVIVADVVTPFEGVSRRYNETRKSERDNGENARDVMLADSKQILIRFAHFLQAAGAIIVSMRYKQASFFFSDGPQSFNLDVTEYGICLEVLSSVGLLGREIKNMPLPSPMIGEFTLYIEMYKITDIGRALLRAFARYKNGSGYHSS